MDRLNIPFYHPIHSDDAIADSLTEILSANQTLAMASTRDCESYINTAFFACNHRLELVLFTAPRSTHGRNLAANRSIAAAIWNTPATWGAPLQGMQIFGTCEIAFGVQLVEAIETFTERFPQFAQVATSAADFEQGRIQDRLYVIYPERIKLVDSRRFGSEQPVEIQLIPERVY